MSELSFTRRGSVSVIELPGSDLSLANLRTFADAIESATADPHVGVVLVAGPAGTFCAGGDLSDFLACGDFDELAAVVRRFMTALAAVDKPMFAAVDGAAVGLGMTMLLHFDAVFATPESTFNAPFADLGLVPEAGSTLLAPARFGYLRAFELLCMGRTLSAVEAQAIGLISEVTTSGGATDRALEAASRIARKPREALCATRRLLRGDRPDLSRRVEAELTQFRIQLEHAPTAQRLTRLTRAARRNQAA